MRNLKKTLCLLLALVFVLGLCTVGAAGTAYGDEDEIQYDTAVKAMSGLGILQGDDNDGDGVNEFRPKDPVTRAQAAKIIAYAVLGKESAEMWPARQVFDDVPADHWAAKYITYCERNGIINGYGNGSFGPNDPVTEAAFAKMILSSCGYGAKDEFTGPRWDENVIAAAMQNKVTKGLVGVHWDEPATREETAQLAYNGMMNVVQVVLSNDTNSYVPVSINGVSGVTLAQSTWNLVTEEGVIIANKANSSSAKGTILAGGARAYYVTELDEDPSVLGHKVQITYRIESQGTGDTAVAYFIDDECTEVNGAEAARHDDAAFQYAFTSGELKGTVPAKAARAAASGIFVLDGDGKVVAYKTEGFFIATLTVNVATGLTTVVEPYGATTVTVQAPAGARTGDIVTVFHNGDIYLAKATVRRTQVAITQAGLDSATGLYTYNDGAIVLTKADKFNLTVLSGLSRLDGTAQLEVGYSYTLVFDSEGGCIGFADKQNTSGVTATKDYVFLVATYEGKDTFGSATYNAQVIRDTGATEILPIAKTAYDAGLTSGVYKVSVSGGINTLIPAGAGEIDYVLYSTNDPLTDYSQAAYIWYSGSLGSLQVKTNQKPKAGSAVYYAYANEKEGTVTLRRVKAVWFTVPESSTVVVNNSFIYLADTKPIGTKLLNGAAADYYNGYLNGEKMNDLFINGTPAKAGIATYTKAATGLYTLSYLPDGNGTATGARTVIMTDKDNNYFFLNGKLYIADALGNKNGMDATGLKIVKVGAAETVNLNLNSITAMNEAMVNGYKLTITFAELVDANGNHTIGGQTLYVTAIS